jgi:2-polyprenyl-3-methyl-5-hydroxy-6-metoxy-1,4-benzoquinol methylase
LTRVIGRLYAWLAMTRRREGNNMSKRPEIQALVNPKSLYILEVGCASGELSAELKKENPARILYGVDPDSCLKVNECFFNFFCQKFEDFSTEFKFDCIIFPDVLEHMIDPWAMLGKARSHLFDDGYIIVSIPNLSHWTVVYNLMLGKFDYADNGILDRTHLRFFTCNGIKALIEASGFEIQAIVGLNYDMPVGLEKYFRLGSVRERNIYQLVVKARIK